MVSLRVIIAAIIFTYFSEALDHGIQDKGPIPPSQDPWYMKPPLGWEKTKPGTVLAARVAPGNLTSIVGNSSEAHNILYRSTNAYGNPSWAVTTVFTPNYTSDAHFSSLVSFQVAYDTPDVDWSPSYGLYSIYDETSPYGIPSDGYFISQLLGLGYFVTVPDYEGPLASFGDGIQAGHAVLDAVRATLSSRNILQSHQVRYALWGYSGGALASGWATELQSRYAPELNVRGAALGGLPADLALSITSINNSSFSGLIPSGIVGVATQNETVNTTLVEYLKDEGPYNITGFFSVKSSYLAENSVVFDGQDMSLYFINDTSTLDVPGVRDLVNSHSKLGQGSVPQVPTFIYMSIEDKVALIPSTDALVQEYCSEGASILFQRNTVGGHIAETANGAPRAMKFLEDALSGNGSSLQGCTVQNVTVSISTISDPM